MVVPEAIPISCTAAPHGVADVIVQYYHETSVGQSVNGLVKDVHRCFAHEAWVSCKGIRADNWIFIKLLQGVDKADTVEGFVCYTLR